MGSENLNNVVRATFEKDPFGNGVQEALGGRASRWAAAGKRSHSYLNRLDQGKEKQRVQEGRASCVHPSYDCESALSHMYNFLNGVSENMRA